jgi:hypothetical protein
LKYKNGDKLTTTIVAVWLQTTALNFPRALCWQIVTLMKFVLNLIGKRHK